ncbi:hypothetical protein [Bacillus sp. T33-2]|uniref:hypothetical protein n=1 Tax=Bacillus sp. T33-2 TaxID=2054168 RepID=UPI000C77A6B6|nr:hypothetical protein [Bacillus sp. T33-2]PLR92017.1 hypothetical protein CVD19_20930 [Bacillus sp. T33-2]
MDNLQLAQLIQEEFRDIKKEIEDIKTKLGAIEKHSSEDLSTLLKATHKHTRNLESDVIFLTQKVGTQERLLNRIEKLIET